MAMLVYRSVIIYKYQFQELWKIPVSPQLFYEIFSRPRGQKGKFFVFLLQLATAEADRWIPDLKPKHLYSGALDGGLECLTSSTTEDQWSDLKRKQRFISP